MKLQEIKTSKFDGFGVLIPEDAELIGRMDDEFWSYFSKSKGWGKFPLKGQYKIIGIKTEITEGQAKEVVKFIGHPWCAYEDFLNKHNWFSTALESFNSLCQKLEMTDSKWLIIQKIR